MTEQSVICIEVVCALPERQLLLSVELPSGTSARNAVVLSAIQDKFPEVNISDCALGVFGKEVADDYPLVAGDRVEIYRPLLNDPRETRRTLAASGGTMGSTRPAD
jgi:putative ubiquitin-RnfH superfamily antitoxin RatB of RatAB toxin-antitoxin module